MIDRALPMLYVVLSSLSPLSAPMGWFFVRFCPGRSVALLARRPCSANGLAASLLGCDGWPVCHTFGRSSIWLLLSGLCAIRFLSCPCFASGLADPFARSCGSLWLAC